MKQIPEVNMNSPYMKTFSNTNDATNFQTEAMKNKINMVHKKKKRRNFKNIEPLENINDVEPTIDNPSTRTTSEPFATFSEDDWTQPDNIYEGGGPKRSTKKFSAEDSINSLYDAINNVITKIAETIVNIGSGKSKNKADIPVVKKYVCWFLSMIAAIIAVYNWAFMMFYKEHGDRVELYDISRESLHEAGIGNTIYALLDFLLDIPLFFPEKLQEYFVKSGPEFLTSYINVAICFILLFVILIRFFYSSASSIRKILIDIASVNMSNPILSFMYGTTFLLYVLSFFEFQPISAALNVAKLVAGFPASLIMPFISNIFKIFFLMMFSVPIAATLCFLYLFVFSFFGIPLLSKDGFFATIKKIHQYINANKLPVKDETICKPMSMLDKIVNNFNVFLNFIYRYVIRIGFIAMFIYGLIDYVLHIKGPVLKIVLMCINSMAIILLGVTIFTSYITEVEPSDVLPMNDSLNNSKPTEMSFDESLKEDIHNATEFVNNVYEKLPSLDKVKSSLPTMDDVANKMQSVSKVIEVIPKVNNINVNFNPTTEPVVPQSSVKPQV